MSFAKGLKIGDVGAPTTPTTPEHPAEDPALAYLKAQYILNHRAGDQDVTYFILRALRDVFNLAPVPTIGFAQITP